MIHRLKTNPQNPTRPSSNPASPAPAAAEKNPPSPDSAFIPQSAIRIPHSAIAIPLRPYQQAAFNSTAGLEIWLWARQTGKSHTLAAWAIHRLLTRPGRLVTILSNSKQNGIELNRKIADLWHQLTTQMPSPQRSMPTAQFQTLPNQPSATHHKSHPSLNSHSEISIPQSAICIPQFVQLDLSPNTRFESFNTETRITLGGTPPFASAKVNSGEHAGGGLGKPTSASPNSIPDPSHSLNPQSLITGRIKILAANPRTARGFSGDLILDEFAFHENAPGHLGSRRTHPRRQPGLSLPHRFHPQRQTQLLLRTRHQRPNPSPQNHPHRRLATRLPHLPPHNSRLHYATRSPPPRPQQTRLRPKLRMQFQRHQLLPPHPRTHLQCRSPQPLPHHRPGLAPRPLRCSILNAQ